MRTGRGEPAQRLAERHDVATVHSGLDRLVGGAQPVAVIDDNHPAAGQRPGEADRAGSRSQNRLAGGPGQVDPTMTG
ncbi:MAG TPA: hypothetical protein VHN80_09570 [Kineosporiaceae bacterium]|nr:hypothetical protein [Kineosporiaceae bacterium]